MFAGAVYLCSVLHFAPAQPPDSFTSWLIHLTNGFPLIISLVYIVARSVYEPSPLTLLVKLPLHYFLRSSSNQPLDVQLDCWMLQSKYDSIEEIEDLPNLVLIVVS